MNYYSYACFLVSPEKLKVETPETQVKFSLASKEDKNLVFSSNGESLNVRSFLVEEDDLVKFLYEINRYALGPIACSNLGREKAEKIFADLSLATSKFTQEVVDILNREA